MTEVVSEKPVMQVAEKEVEKGAVSSILLSVAFIDVSGPGCWKAG